MKILRHTLTLVVMLWAAGTASATPWADALFDSLSHDFGATPHGPIVRHTFTVTNNTGQRLHIGSVRVSCGCLTATATKNELAPGEEGAVVVTMDTRRFRGFFAKTVFVLFDQPQVAEVRLTVQATSRDDITLTPETLAFGQVAPGSEAKATITVSLPDNSGAAVDVKSDSAFVQPRIKLLSREGGTASYELTAQLRSNLPAGSWYSTVWLTTNTATMPRLLIPVTVEVKTP